MKRLYLSLMGCLSICLSAIAQYQPDILGDGYQCRTLQLANDYEGEVVTTLVRKPPLPETDRALLYVHGYNDYFFQKELGDSLNAHGYNFYALDLRKYGRSLRPHQDAFFCKDLSEYFADLDTALTIIRQEGNREIFLMGHSTGGLITSYYLYHRKGLPGVQGLILNSPFLDWNAGEGWMENYAFPLVSLIGYCFPTWTVQEAGQQFSRYAASLLRSHRGEWEFNEEWKRPYGHPIRAGWIHAIHSAQQTLQEGAGLTCPILLLSSDHSVMEEQAWDDRYLAGDLVLDVNDIQQYGRRLGDRVTAATIPNGLHDLILSTLAARQEAYRVIFDWLGQR